MNGKKNVPGDQKRLKKRKLHDMYINQGSMQATETYGASYPERGLLQGIRCLQSHWKSWRQGLLCTLKKKNFYLFIFGCVGSSLRCAGFSLQWLLLLWSSGSRRTGFSCCGTWAQQLCLAGSRAQAQQLWHMGLAASWHVGSSWTRARTRVPCIGRQILNHCATREAPPLHFLTVPEL